MLMLQSSEPYLNSWKELAHSVLTGEPAFNHIDGEGLFEYASETPSFGELFDRAFAAGSRRSAIAIARAYNFSGLNQVADIGGGNGALLAEILTENPELHGVLFDLPEVVTRAPAALEAAGVLDRCKIMAGSFFDTIPAGRDIYTLKAIIHAWGDPQALTILKNCRAAMKPDSKLLVIGVVLPEIIGSQSPSAQASIGDLELLVMLGGRERTESEYRELYGKAGLGLKRIIPVEGPGIFAGNTVILEGVID